MGSQTFTLHTPGLRSRRMQPSAAVTLSLSSSLAHASHHRTPRNVVIFRFRQLLGLVAPYGHRTALFAAGSVLLLYIIGFSVASVLAKHSRRHWSVVKSNSVGRGYEVSDFLEDGAALRGGIGKDHTRRWSSGKDIATPRLESKKKSDGIPGTAPLPRRRRLADHKARVLAYVNLSRHLARRMPVNLPGREAPLAKLPKTRWLHNAQLQSFIPPRSPRTDMRLITLGDACFCTQRDQFLLPRPHYWHHEHFPRFLHRHRAARLIAWKNPRSLLAFPRQNAVHVPGLTVLWRGRALSAGGPHLLRSLLPIRALVDLVRKTRFGSNVKIAAEEFEPSEGPLDERVRQMQEYFLGDVAPDDRISFRSVRPRLLCFDRVVALGSEYAGRVPGREKALDTVKDLVMQVDGGRIPSGLAKHCRQNEANRETVWIIDRQNGHGDEGSIENIAEVVTAVNHELLRAGLADRVTARVVQAPDLRCPAGTAMEGCFASDCSEHDGKCDRKGDVLRAVSMFNNMTMAVIVAGPIADDVVYMPRGAGMVEVIPHGVVRKSSGMAGAAGVAIWQVRNRPDTRAEQGLRTRFGDLTGGCWGDDDCRKARVSIRTRVDIRRLRSALAKGLRRWKRDCCV